VQSLPPLRITADAEVLVSQITLRESARLIRIHAVADIPQLRCDLLIQSC
jgi:hypothetical protein